MNFLKQQALQKEMMGLLKTLYMAAAKSLQSCPTLCDPIDRSPSGSSVHGIFQARVLEWSAIAFSVYMAKCLHHLTLTI